jgi:hypothetical protein
MPKWTDPRKAFGKPPKPLTEKERLEQLQDVTRRPVVPVEDEEKRIGGYPVARAWTVVVPASGTVILNTDENQFDSCYVISSDADANNGYDTSLWRLVADDTPISFVHAGVRVTVNGTRKWKIVSTGAFTGTAKGYLFRAVDFEFKPPWGAGLDTNDQLRPFLMTSVNELVTARSSTSQTQNDLYAISENASDAQGSVGGIVAAVNQTVVASPGGGAKLIVTDVSLLCTVGGPNTGGMIVALWHYSGSAIIWWRQVIITPAAGVVGATLQQQHHFGITAPVSNGNAAVQVDILNAAGDGWTAAARCKYF